MKALRLLVRLVQLTGVAALLLASAAFARNSDSEIVAVSSRVSDGYKREKLPDGTFAPETYAFGKGGKWASTHVDASVDKIPFDQVVQILAPPLAAQKYVSSTDPKKTKLLIMVYWGKTEVPPSREDSVQAQNVSRSSSELAYAKASGIPRREIQAQQDLADAADMEKLENRQRDDLDFQNANMLGYDEEWKHTRVLGAGPLSFRHQDLITELEDSRYFVVLMAYDFPLLWKRKTKKLLWETRFSIRAHDNAFDKSLNAMTKKASKFFGQDSHGLQHKELPQEDIQFGEVKVIDDPKSK